MPAVARRESEARGVGEQRETADGGPAHPHEQGHFRDLVGKCAKDCRIIIMDVA